MLHRSQSADLIGLNLKVIDFVEKDTASNPNDKRSLQNGPLTIGQVTQPCSTPLQDVMNTI
jgi:hypothetical protein